VRASEVLVSTKRIAEGLSPLLDDLLCLGHGDARSLAIPPRVVELGNGQVDEFSVLDDAREIRVGSGEFDVESARVGAAIRNDLDSAAIRNDLDSATRGDPERP